MSVRALTSREKHQYNAIAPGYMLRKTPFRFELILIVCQQFRNASRLDVWELLMT